MRAPLWGEHFEQKSDRISKIATARSGVYCSYLTRERHTGGLSQLIDGGRNSLSGRTRKLINWEQYYSYEQH